MASNYQVPTYVTGRNANPAWEQVDTYTLSHLHPSSSTPDPAILDSALARCKAANLPPIHVSAAQGKYLMLQARLLGARSILEVGTLGGYSTIFLAAANKSVRVTTVEVDPHHADVARENLSAADVRDRVDVLLGPGIEVLPRLLDEVKSGVRPPFDFVFIDADKENNWNYFDLAVQMSRPGTCVIVDNVVRNGTLVDEEKVQNDPRVQGARKVVEKVGQDSRVDAVVLQIVGGKSYDGMLIAVVGEP